MYAILSHGGRQHRVSAGDRLVVDRLDAEVGSVIALEPVLLTGGEGTTALGADVDGTRVAVTVVKHLRGEKLRIFKYKAKKRSRKLAGYRSDLTELRVESILTKGAALPKPARAEVADKPAAKAPKPAGAKAAEPARAEAMDQPAAKAVRPAAADKPAAKAAGTAKRASKAPAAAVHDIEDTDKDTDKAGSTQRATAKTAAAKPRAPRTTKAAPKSGRGGAAAGDGDKESGGGA